MIVYAGNLVANKWNEIKKISALKDRHPFCLFFSFFLYGMKKSNPGKWRFDGQHN